jgi:hypothetical protein
MVGGLKIILVEGGHEQEFESLFGELRVTIREHEPDCLVYSLLRSRTNPRSFIVQEQYRDQSALDAQSGIGVRKGLLSQDACNLRKHHRRVLRCRRCLNIQGRRWSSVR